jgi:hypothetical protein
VAAVHHTRVKNQPVSRFSVSIHAVAKLSVGQMELWLLCEVAKSVVRLRREHNEGIETQLFLQAAGAVADARQRPILSVSPRLQDDGLPNPL